MAPLFTLSSGAAAQPAPAATSAAAAPSATAIATQKYTDGAELAKQGRWKDAYPLFLEAWSHLQHWQIAASLGRVEVEIGKFHAAEKHLSFALSASDLPASDRAEVTRLIALAKQNQGTIRIVATAKAPARVLVDDELVGTTPFTGTTSADPGEHRVELRFGTRREGRAVTIEAAKTTR